MSLAQVTYDGEGADGAERASPAKACPCCGRALHQIGENIAERLDVVRATVRELVTRCPRVARPGGGRGLPLVRARGGPSSGATLADWVGRAA